MNKRFIIIIMSVVIIFSTITIYMYNTETCISIGSLLTEEVLSEELINSYLSVNEKEKEKIEGKIKKIVLKDMNHDKWLEYIDYVKVIIYPADIADDSRNELIIGLNLSKNLGSIGIYKLDKDKYKLSDQIDNLATIEKISVERNSNNDKRFLILEEFLDERLGAYFTDKFTRIFTKTNDKFEEVFRESIDYEAYFHEKWLDKEKENPKWFKLEEKNVINYDKKTRKLPTITVHKTAKKFEGKRDVNTKIPSEFKEVEKKEFKENYTWSTIYKKFIIAEGEVISTGEKVAILEDMSKNVDYLLNLDGKYYKIITRNMKIKHIRHEDIRIDDL